MACFKSGNPPSDSDRDGMTDEWERSRCLDPNNAGDGNTDRNGDGYTNIEEYLNNLMGDESPVSGTALNSPGNLRIIIQ